jgi:putative nucleotidyltransferase with HDIG domain
MSKVEAEPMDCQKVLDAFAEYTGHYDCSDGKIKLKIDHTYRVAGLCRRIAASLGLNDADAGLAWVIGMLHDIGRFEQLRKYGTFSDAESIDHAHYGVEILFHKGRIHDYLVIHEQDAEYGIIRTAIYNHSAYRVESGLDQRTKMFCDIIRDADKVDILKVNHDVPLEVIYNASTEELKNAEVTGEVMDQFFEKRAVLRSVKRTCVDHIVGHAALVFELVYPESLRIVKEQGYLDKILNYQSDNPRTREQFGELRQCMNEYLRNVENRL